VSRPPRASRHEAPSDGRLAILIADAELVAEYATRAGRVTPELIEALSAIRSATTPPDPAIVDQLYLGLSKAIADIAPVTLLDLRSGWNPYIERPGRKLVRAVFGVCGLLLFVITVWCSALYNKAGSVLAALHTIQDSRPTEQVARVYRAATVSQKALSVASDGTGRDILYDNFTRSIADLQQLNERITAFVPLAYEVKGALDSPVGALLRMIGVSQATTSASVPSDAAPSTDPLWQAKIREWQANYAASQVIPDSQAGSPETSGASSSPPATPNLVTPTLEAQIDADYRSLSRFNQAIGIKIHPQAFPQFTKLISDIEDGRSLLGTWVIPGLYGMLGAMVFHMRRILDPFVPDPPVPRLVYRICLGGLAGVVIAWFWSPAAVRPGELGAASFSSFSVAFLIGYSIDIFFQLLDKLVDSAATAVGKPRPTMRSSVL